MKTLEELNRLEQLAYETGLRGDALQAEFNKKPRFAEPKPLVESKETTSFQYCAAIRRYLLGRDHPNFIDEQRMFAILSAKKIIVPWGHAPEGWPNI